MRSALKFTICSTCCRATLARMRETRQARNSIVKNVLCIHARSQESIGLSISTRSWKKASISPITGTGREGRLQYHPGAFLHPATGEVNLLPQEITPVLLNLISNSFYATTQRKAEANGAS